MAEQLHFFDIPSPCVGICQLNEKATAGMLPEP